MLFNSGAFLIFLPIVLALHGLAGRVGIRAQNLLILVASYVFYGWWDWRFLSLIAFSTVVDYGVGLVIAGSRNEARRRAALVASLVVNLGLLGFFKYFNFFIESWVDLWATFGVASSASTLQIILPVGISFYTFQTLSYSIDVYRRRLEPTRDFIAFAAFVSFFPQLVAGPIERAAHLLPQITGARRVERADVAIALRLIAWGFFKKLVIADSLSPVVDEIFAHHADHSSGTLILGAVFFAFQIYGDFSGYSDIAIGVARLFGIELMVNFAMPYFSRDIAEFWRRWHISLSTWFRDYLYIPLGGSRGSMARSLRNIFIIFLVSGFWHGANWTFIAWGGVHALLYVPLLLRGRNRTHAREGVAAHAMWPSARELLEMSSTFALVVLAWVFFRSLTLADAFAYIGGIVSRPGPVLHLPHLVLPAVLVGIEWSYRNATAVLKKSYYLDAFAWSIVGWSLFVFQGEAPKSFIYFQF